MTQFNPSLAVLKNDAPVILTLEKKRVSAYCRVSTNNEEQKSSLATQIDSFRKIICSHPGWELGEIYVDEGLSATRAESRPEFMRMIRDAQAGKFDYLITKSVSRFARNCKECLTYVDILKERGVYVLFDENKLDTGNPTSSLVLSIMAAIAQEESRSFSERMKSGMRMRMQMGIPKWSATYGYTRDKKGEIHIVEEQAQAVRRIFELYTKGSTLPQIVQKLTEEGIQTMTGKQWWPKIVAGILHNEKYVGDVMMQKTYTVDHISHKKVRNDQRVIPSYYLKDHHEPIVDRETFAMAQTILEMRDPHKGCVQYPYYGTLVCPICGAKMVGFRLPVNGMPFAWTCSGEKGANCPPYALYTKYVDRAVQEAFKQLRLSELKALAAGDGLYKAAVEKAIEWKNRHLYLRKIEYILLYELVEQITFVNWTEAQITWKFGQKTRVPVKYDKVSDIPCVELDLVDDIYTLNGKTVRNGQLIAQRIENVKACCEEIRAHGGRPKAVLRRGGRTDQANGAEQ